MDVILGPDVSNFQDPEGTRLVYSRQGTFPGLTFCPVQRQGLLPTEQSPRRTPRQYSFRLGRSRGSGTEEQGEALMSAAGFAGVRLNQRASVWAEVPVPADKGALEILGS